MKSNKPQFINENVWYYENNKSLDFYVQYAHDKNPISFRVRFSKLKKSIERAGGDY